MSMGYLTTNMPNLQIIEVTVEGLLDFDFRQRILSKSLLKLIGTGYTRLMIDISNTYSPVHQSMAEALHLTSFMKTIGYHDTIRLAFLYRDEDDFKLYLESTAMAQGFNIKYFRKRENAIDWLCEEAL